MVIKAIETVATIMLLIFTGILITELGWYGRENKNFLSKLIINISVPAVILKTFLHSFPRELLLGSFKLMLLAFTSIMFSYFLAKILAQALKLEGERKTNFTSLSSVSNAMFVGLPVNLSILGEDSLAFLMVYYFVNTVLLWTFFAPKYRVKELDNGLSQSKFKIRMKKIFSIPLITLIVSLILSFFNFKLPSILLNTIGYLSNLSTPLSLIFIGGVIAEVGLKNIKLEVSMIYIILLKFIITPIIMIILLRLAGVGALASKVFILTSAMPPMTQLGVLAASYGDDGEYAMTVISTLTLISLIFIPIYVYLFPIIVK